MTDTGLFSQSRRAWWAIFTLAVFTMPFGAATAQSLTGGGYHADPPEFIAEWTVGDTLIDGQAWIVAELYIGRGCHVYQARTSVVVAPPEGIVAGETVNPKPEISYDQFEGREVPKYKGTVQFRVPLTVVAEPAGDTVVVTVAHQGCTESMCFFPTSEEHRVRLRSIPEPDPSRASAVAPADTLRSIPGSTAGLTGDPGDDLRAALAEGGVLLALGLMFIGGLLTSMTPCVYPLIPLTVAFFGASRTSALRGFLLSLVFVLGMATMYSILGVSAAATGAVFGSVISNPFVVGAIAIVFLAFAASMFGVFKIQLPASLQTKLSGVGGTGPVGSYLAGLVAGVIAAPCTGPVLGAALTYIATTGDVVLGFFAMFTFAFGMGMLFIVIGTFSARIAPRSGGWLKVVESVFGVVMLVAALYFLKDIIRPLGDLMFPGTKALLVSLALAVAGAAIGAFHLRFYPALDEMGSPEPAPGVVERIRKGAGVLLVVAGFYGLIGYFLAPPPQPNWVHDEAAGLAWASAEGKPVVIDAYADWCVACKELDKYTWSDPAVLAEMNRFMAIKLDFTRQSTCHVVLTAKYGRQCHIWPSERRDTCSDGQIWHCRPAHRHRA